LTKKLALCLDASHATCSSVVAALRQQFPLQPLAHLLNRCQERLTTEVYPLDHPYELIQVFATSTPESDQSAPWTASWPLWVVPEDQQHPAIHAFLEAARRGYTHAIYLSPLTMNVDEDQIGQWFDQLDHHQVLFGPTEASFFLLGLVLTHAEVFDGLELGGPHPQDLVQIRCESHELKLCLLPQRPGWESLEAFTQFRKDLNEEHYIGKIIDQMVLEHLKADPQWIQELNLMEPQEQEEEDDPS
jgi:hypothetical protein